jgi:hypothetical protein
MNYFCCDERRRNAVAAHTTLNGIEFLEVSDDPSDPVEQRQRTLFVHLLKDLVPGALTAQNVRVEGGERVRGISVTSLTEAPGGDAHVIAVETDERGDFSTYTLRLVDAVDAGLPPEGFDPVLSAVDFSFKVACPSDFDCEEERACRDEPRPAPAIDYLAKDYQSFRRLMLDRMATLAPRWRERHAADLGVALVELLAYVGDYLSYQQDAVATEAYIGAARRRVSVRRHARLVDYPMHDGSNARAWVQARVSADGVNLARRTQILTRAPKQEPRIAPLSSEYEEALSSRPVVFETMHDATLYEAHNEIRFHTWGEERCCLPRGATRATLRNDGERLAGLKAGDVLIFVETRNPQNGNPEEADTTHRHAVRLTQLKPATDPLFTEDGSQPLRVLNVTWADADALPFPLCLWDVEVGGDSLPASVALGNVVLADHGMTVASEPLGAVPPPNPVLDKLAAHGSGPCRAEARRPTPPRFRPRLRGGNVTHAAPYDHQNPPASARAVMRRRASEFLPEVVLTGVLDGNGSHWFPKRDLLNSDAEAREFVLEIEDDGASFVRFGDDRFGSRPAVGTEFEAAYRVGNGAEGNVGAETLAHIVTDVQAVSGVNNPLAALGGTDPESAERVRQDAPVAFRTQERAVTPKDYARMTERHAGVERAAAGMRWTGSWRTIFLTVDRRGGLDVTQDFEDELTAHLERYRMAGHDIEIDGPRYVPLEITLTVCVEPGYFRGDVRAALLELFGRRTLPDGRRGLFHPDNFTFGQTVYLSPVVAAAQSVEGVSSVAVTRFRRQGVAGSTGLQAGKLELGRLEIARLDNDPNFPDRGVLRLHMKGGR